MALKLRPDNDLSILALSSHEDLNRLAWILTRDADGKKRRSQALLDDPAFMAAEKNGDLRPAWKSVAAELQAYGGDSLANTWRSLTTKHSGVCYREILNDICDKLAIRLTQGDDIKELEDQFLVGLILEQKENFTQDRLTRAMDNAAKSVGMSEHLPESWNLEELTGRIPTDTRISCLASIAVPDIASLTLPLLARLPIPAALAAAGRTLPPAVLAAAGLGVTALSTGLGLAAGASLLTSPAFRVTLPAVFEIIRMRRLAILFPWFAGETA